MYNEGSEWNKKGGTLSDKSARKEFGLTQEEIIDAIRAGKLQYRQNHIHGNPYLRLLRREVETFVDEKYGRDYLKTTQLKNELAQVNRDIKRLKTQMKSLEQRKQELVEILGE